jgi:hypothetical protein
MKAGEFFGKVNDALKALRKLVPRLRDWLVAPKSDLSR